MNVDVTSLIFSISDMLSILSNHKRKVLVKGHWYELFLFVYCTVINLQYNSFVLVDCKYFCIKYLVRFFMRNWISTTNTWLQKRIILIKIGQAIIIKFFLATYIKISNSFIWLLTLIKAEIVFLPFLLNVLPVLKDNNSFIVCNH